MIPLIIGAAIGGGKALYGAYQSQQAKKEAKAAEEALRQSLAIPESVYQMVGEAERKRSTGMPGEELAKSQLRESTQTGVSAVQAVAPTGTMAIGALNDLFAKEQQNLRRLSQERLSYKERADAAYMQTLNVKAGYEARKQSGMQGIASNQYSNAIMMGQGATQNIWGGLQEVAGSFLQGKMAKDRAAEVDKIYGRPASSTPISQSDINPIVSNPNSVKASYDFSNGAWFGNGFSTGDPRGAELVTDTFGGNGFPIGDPRGD